MTTHVWLYGIKAVVIVAACPQVFLSLQSLCPFHQEAVKLPRLLHSLCFICGFGTIISLKSSADLCVLFRAMGKAKGTLSIIDAEVTAAALSSCTL